MDCYVDADFAGLCPHEDKQDPLFMRNHTGFAICIANCPIIWSSKLQGDIMTSTMEAEYMALSMVMKSVLPLLNVLKSDWKRCQYVSTTVDDFQNSIWEDNNGALTLANLEPD